MSKKKNEEGQGSTLQDEIEDFLNVRNKKEISFICAIQGFISALIDYPPFCRKRNFFLFRTSTAVDDRHLLRRKPVSGNGIPEYCKSTGNSSLQGNIA